MIERAGIIAALWRRGPRTYNTIVTSYDPSFDLGCLAQQLRTDCPKCCQIE